MAKAVVAAVEPALLADRGDRDSILVLTDKAHLAGTGPTRVKTIGVFEALRTAKHVNPHLPVRVQSDLVSITVRNAAVHLATVDADELRAAIREMCRIIDGLRTCLDLDAERFWGAHGYPVAQAMIDEDETLLRQVVAAKVGAAQARFKALMSGLDAASQKLVFASLSGRTRSMSDHEEPQQCPVCDAQGWLICGVFEDTDDLIEFRDQTGDLLGYGIRRIATPFSFECPVCDLDLDDRELAGFGFRDEIELEPRDVEPEPDEDW